MQLFRQFGWPELLLVLAIVILIFGPGRLGKVASELGQGIRSFREGLAGEDEQGDGAEEGDGNSQPGEGE